VAEAEFDLARVRRAKVVLIGRIVGLGALDSPELFESVWKELRFFDAPLRGKIPWTRPRLPTPTRDAS
jgi:hypothetical protein